MAKKAVWVLLLVAVLPFSASAEDIFTRNLYFGLRSDEQVQKLQGFLQSTGFFGSQLTNGNYLWTTVEAVKKFQQAHGIYPASGYFGIKTRILANKLAKENPSIKTSAVIAPTKISVPPAPILLSKESPHKGKFNMYAYDSSVPENESIHIQNQSDSESIDVTGFRIENIYGSSYIIPKAHYLPAINSNYLPEDRVVLKPYERMIVTVGRQSMNMDFQTNICTGYFSGISKFTPPMYQRCPRVETGKLPLDISDRCINIIQSTLTCRQPDYTQVFESSCSDYLNKHLSYAGCVADNRSRKDFYSGEWYFWMQRREEFLRGNREVITLKDREGREIVKFSY